MRLDKWLWFARFYKTRTLAAKAVVGGHVKLNGVRARTSATIVPGDSIAIVRDQLSYNLTVEKLPVRRGPGEEARSCYSESEDSIRSREKMRAELSLDRKMMPRTDGRPDKHTRRKLRARNRNETQ